MIRHGKTEGNLEKRYIGSRTDEALCEEGIREIRMRISEGYYPDASRLFVSPLLRCRESAALIYPALQQIVIPDFRECDFGSFEGRNYNELSGDPAYQAWINSGGTLPFPGGESRDAFVRRIGAAFQKMCESIMETPFSADAFHVRQLTCGAAPSSRTDMHRKTIPEYTDTLSREDLALVVHGGTIMAVMQLLTGCDYYDYQLANGDCLLLEITELQPLHAAK